MRKLVPPAALLGVLSLSTAAGAQQPPPQPQPQLQLQPQPPQGYPPPYITPYPLVLPRTLPFRENVAPPPGYRLETQMNRALVAAGTSVLGGAYLLSFMTAGTAVSSDCSGCSDWASLFIPVVGPFITLGVVDDVSLQGDGAFGGITLLLDGVTQVTGAVLLIAGLVSNDKIWVRSDIPKKAEAPRPEVLVGPRGGAVRFRF